MGGTKKIAWDMLKCPPYRGLHCPAGGGDGAGGCGDIDIEGDDVSPLHYIEDIELQYTEVPHLRCSDKD